MTNHKSTAKKAKAVSAALASDPDSLVRFADLLKLRSLAATTQAEYLRYVRKLAARKKCDPATLDETAVREHLLYLKDKCGHSASTIRTAAAAFTAFYIVAPSLASSSARSSPLAPSDSATAPPARPSSPPHEFIPETFRTDTRRPSPRAAAALDAFPDLGSFVAG